MNNNGLKRGRRSQADAEKYLKYHDGTPYTHIPGLKLNFNDRNRNEKYGTVICGYSETFSAGLNCSKT